MAIAFADLYISDPTDVTDYHKKMLKKEFSQKEIEELTILIKQELFD